MDEVVVLDEVGAAGVVEMVGDVEVVEEKEDGIAEELGCGLEEDVEDEDCDARGGDARGDDARGDEVT